MVGNLIISTNTSGKDALAMLKGLSSETATHRSGLKAGFKYVRAHSKRIGIDPSIDQFAAHLAKAANGVVTLWIGEGFQPDKSLPVARDCKWLLDLYTLKPNSFGIDYAEVRCVCLFNLAELFRSAGKITECIRFLEDCEKLIVDRHICESSSGSKLPSLPVIQTCLAEVLLLNGQMSPSVSKSGEVISFYQRRASVDMITSDWTAYAYALLIHCRGCIKQGKLLEAEGTVSLAAQCKLACIDLSVIAPILDKIEREIRDCRRAQRRKVKERLDWEKIANDFDKFLHTTPAPPGKRPQSASAGVSHRRVPTIRPRSSGSHRTQVLSVASKSVVIPPPLREACGVQTDGHHDWRVLKASASGKEYYYNSVNGVSTWTKPLNVR